MKSRIHTFIPKYAEEPRIEVVFQYEDEIAGLLESLNEESTEERICNVRN
ncbi:hypothetical protein Lac2_25830 [Claveliimonas bilis]|nr:hypothetical protein Lac2_25830 [Claveliimonas bilis]